MQSLTEQLVEALERISAALGEGENILVRQRRPELAEAYHRIKAVADTALDRARADPEALLREAGQARREEGERVRDEG